MVLKYNIPIDNSVIDTELKKLTNQIYKLLPNREENIDWQKPLETIMVELAGMNRLIIEYPELMLPLLSKLEGLFTLTDAKDFFIFRRTIFECLSLISDLRGMM